MLSLGLRAVDLSGEKTSGSFGRLSRATSPSRLARRTRNEDRPECAGRLYPLRQEKEEDGKTVTLTKRHQRRNLFD